ncbi:hypothetical protein M680_12160 [Neisseria gonorrhoeae SK8976]|nr:hypothetical protein M680_12160 [Neisseria gonorrhoeae SK8976]KLR97844.1 hypothetical protein M674_11070 [Neisseria gonorrhoeae SK708]KLT04465.1 hypothetical protein M782_11230 [Neisseria gonorrhoeae MU_NG17]
MQAVFQKHPLNKNKPPSGRKSSRASGAPPIPP